MISNEVQASKTEGLEGREDGRFPRYHPRGCRKLQRAKANRTAQAREVGDAGDGGHPITGTVDARCPPHGRRQIVDSENDQQLNLLKMYIAGGDQIWPSIQ
jgi:hypothetical protein